MKVAGVFLFIIFFIVSGAVHCRLMQCMHVWLYVVVHFYQCQAVCAYMCCMSSLGNERLVVG